MQYRISSSKQQQWIRFGMHRFEPYGITKFFKRLFQIKTNVRSIKRVNMNASMPLDHINVHVHLVMNYSPVENAKVKNISSQNFRNFTISKIFKFTSQILMNAKLEIMHVLPMKNVTIPEAVTNVSIWDVHLDTSRYLRVQQTGKII